ncbi:hypothetical protein J7399_13980 [Shimia sp. R9_1]|uniref:hypothetical protein n=1 Tax=unclassified Shimia TaxID=2630038 RepID=UPI001AD9ED1F|nr:MULTISPECIES: hypothetical protein [unclassified Shimia]MBO9397494.1 hypothetical protein [Shimia sp. R9_2]MBO9402118.1 hypothetical protein [Shimia sp. R9_3]MBO9408545.1 hypothetical protein [Shimia sp. R9_1]
MTYSARTTFRSLLCGAALLTMGTAASSLPIWPHQQAQAFATCSGRISALTTHQRAVQNPEADGNAALVETFDLMLEAVLPDALPDEDGTQVSVQWRAQGWSEVAGLLAHSFYSFDRGVAERAEAALVQRIADCRNMVL